MKKPRRLVNICEGILLTFFLAACNLPAKSPTQFAFPTVNLTQTVIFNPTELFPVTETPSNLATATLFVQTTTLLPTFTHQPPTATATMVTPTATAISPTNTSAPTNTAMPPTATLPVARTSPIVVAPLITKVPVIDGSWNDLPSSTEKSANHLVYQNPDYKGTAKAGMSFRIGWDSKYLYIGVKVGDPLYHQGSTGASLYLGDSVEVLIDTNVTGDFNSHSLTADDFQLGISPGYRTAGTSPEAYLWYPAGKAGSRTDVKIGVLNPSAGLYRIEFAIPWSLLGFTPNAGMHLGFVISYSDNESEIKNEQSVMISNDENRILTDPTTWGDLTLAN